MSFSEKCIRDARQEILTNKRPRYLYKYRSIKSAIEFLKNSSIFFSNYQEFNDPFESACKKKYDFTPQEYFETFQQWGVDFYSAAIEAEKVRLGYVDGKEKLRKATEEMLSGFAYFCMTKDPDNILMWSHYADCHKGVCLKFDLLQDLDIFSLTVPVDYNSEYPEFDTLNGNPGVNIITRKSPDWAYEHEHRTVKVNAHGLHKIKKDVLVEVIFGCRTSEEDKTQIRDLVKSNGFNSVSFSKAVVHPEAYKLDIQPHSFPNR